MVITVTDGQSIQAAVHAAAPGDTIQIQPGIFREAIVVTPGKDALRIIGAGAGQTILDGTGLGELTGLSVDGADRITVSGLTLRNFAGHGVSVNGDENTLRDCEITLCSGAGLVIAGERNALYESYLHGNGQQGVLLTSGSDNYIITNRMVANSDRGVLVEEGCFGTLLLENEAAANEGGGIEVRADACRLIGNRTHENRGNGLAVRGAGCILYGNSSTENQTSGLTLDARDVTAAHNQLSTNRSHGVDVASEHAKVGLSEALFFGNEMNANEKAGFRCAEALVHLLVVQCSAEENGAHGLDLAGSERSRILANRVHRNKGSGLHLGSTPRGNIVDANSVRDNRRGGLHVDEEGMENAMRQNHLMKNTPFDLQDGGMAAGRLVLDGNRKPNSSPPEVGG